MNLTDKHAILEALRTGYKMSAVSFVPRWETDPRLREIGEMARQNGVTILEQKEFSRPRKGGGSEPPPTVVATVRDFTYTDLGDIIHDAGPSPVFLALDHVQDPMNLGAIMRTAAAAGARGVVIETRRCCDVTPVVCDTSCGGVFRVPIARVSNLANTLEVFKKANVWVVGADERADADAWAKDLSGAICVVLGNEGTGLSRLVRDRCDFLVRIPTVPDFPSLNVSAAAAVMMFEAKRRR